ncbi:MAG: SPFH domain-containing protein [Defluviitaleaceae bacterium]|nr:SPFH domain-containing protein [Defluviitaleaceae bacterium]MCL2261722.1 SPFH domain-containing protein [Defluviitaleaceae bacterium]
MGLIRAGMNAVGSTLSDQWLEFFYQDAMAETVLVTKGQRRHDKNRKSANQGNDNIISNGSGIAVADGQCMMIVDQGRIMDVCAEPGQYTWNQSSEPSIFAGNLGDSIVNTFKTAARRFAHGGDSGKDQRVYYFNIRELKNNKFGTATPIPFRVVDTNIGLDIDITLRCNGMYSFRMTNPMLFYQNVSGNVEREYTRDQIENQLRSEFLNALQPAFARLSAMGMRYSAIPGHTMELSEALNQILSEQWSENRGLSVVSIAINSLSAPKEDEDMIRNLQRKAVMRDPGMAGAALVNAQAEAMKTAAGNQGGAMMGFMGLGMAQQAGGMDANQMFAMNQQNQQAAMAAQQAQQNQQAAPSVDSWNCTCGEANTGRFCQGCGTPKPAPADSWACACGEANTGRFCQGCGTPKPASNDWTCTCGAANTGRFCQGCGNPKA